MIVIKPVSFDEDIYEGVYILVPETGIDEEFLKGMQKTKEESNWYSHIRMFVENSYMEIKIDKKI